MRFGCCGSMVAKQPDKTGVEFVEQLKETGYDYIELSLSHMAAMAEEEFNRLKKRVAASGLVCEACNNFYPHDMRLTGSDVDMERIKSYTKIALDRAAQLGAQIVVFGSGPAKNVPEGFSLGEGWRQVVQLLRYVDGVARENGIIIAIEPLRKTECNLVNSVSEAVMLAKEVDSNNIKVLVDYYHMIMENEDPSVMVDNEAYIRHVHFANPNGRVFPKEIHENDYQPFIRRLVEVNYKNRISVEAYSINLSQDLVKTLEFLRSVFY